ncbi:holo-ACP synthase [Enemella sp. A6]|uniref:holo-ACP synthase n=1 Tax=Enemella sp. A6 TaxID=3440152 RepID=UPI003EB7065F
MAVVGVGIDVCEVERLRETLLRRPGMVHRLFTAQEAARRVESLAGRWAAKEALAKALGAPAGLVWLDAEVISTASGRPEFSVTGTVAARAAELGIDRIHLSMSHDGGIATAIVVCESTGIS